jgi:glycosyltransferase involved in cell wall biosynthesis
MIRLRLLLVTDTVGGVWVYSLELARALRPLRVETVLAVAGPPPSAKQREEAAAFKLIDTGLPLEWLDTSADEIRRAGEALAHIARHEAVDVVQTSSAALLADAGFAQPCIAVQHSCLASWWAAVKGAPLPAELEWRRELVQQGLRRAAAVVAPSIAFAAETSRIYDVRAETVHNGREPSPICRIPQGHFVFTAGRLWDEGKNAATLDSAAARLHAPFQAAGAIEGPNGARAELKNIQTLGHLNETRLARLYAAGPVYASAALYEPFGLSVLEAAQAGCALVLSDIPTHREMWDGAAIFVPALDSRAFASAIRHLLDDRDKRREVGRRARARAAYFTPERMAREMAGIYARATSGRSPSVRLAGAA